MGITAVGHRSSLALRSSCLHTQLTGIHPTLNTRAPPIMIVTRLYFPYCCFSPFNISVCADSNHRPEDIKVSRSRTVDYIQNQEARSCTTVLHPHPIRDFSQRSAPTFPSHYPFQLPTNLTVVVTSSDVIWRPTRNDHCIQRMGQLGYHDAHHHNPL